MRIIQEHVCFQVFYEVSLILLQNLLQKALDPRV